MQLKPKSVRINLASIIFCLIAGSIFLFVFTTGNIHAAVEGQKTDEIKNNNQPEKQVIVTYFHTTYRCSSCKKLEKYLKEVVEKNFQEDLKSKKLIYRTLDMTEKKNKHFIEDYKLVTKSVVLSIIDDGKELKWKNLPDVLRKVNNKKKFNEFVLKEIREYMKVISDEGK